MKKRPRNREGFDEDKEGCVKRRIEGKRNVRIGKDLKSTIRVGEKKIYRTKKRRNRAGFQKDKEGLV